MTVIGLAFILLHLTRFYNGENLRGSTSPTFRRLEERFNIFKSYKDAANKPPQYSTKKWSKHGIQEYLSPQQRMMYATRYGKDSPDVMFSRKWSGFDKQKRTLVAKVDDDDNGAVDDDAGGADDDVSGDDDGGSGDGYAYTYYSYDYSSNSYGGDDQYYYSYGSYGSYGEGTDDDGTEGYISDTIYLPNRHERKLSSSNSQSKIDSPYQQSDTFGDNFKEISTIIYSNILGISVFGLILLIAFMTAIFKFRTGEDKKLTSIE